MSAKDVLKFIKDKEAEFVDLRFTDPRGKLQHLSMDATATDESMLNELESLVGKNSKEYKAGWDIAKKTTKRHMQIVEGPNTE